MFRPIVRLWKRFEQRFPNSAQFAMFFILSNGVTALQLALMPLFKAIFNQTGLVDVAFQVLPVGSNLDGSQFYIFDYPAGEVQADGTGGGLAYFLAVQITIAIAQVINFFAQRSITFKANNSVWKAAFWYVIAYILITLFAGAAQGFYKVPIYDFMIGNWGSAGETAADVITMIINSAIAFWVFFPIFKIIFKQVPEEDGKDGDAADADGAESATASTVATASSAGETSVTSSVDSGPHTDPAGKIAAAPVAEASADGTPGSPAR